MVGATIALLVLPPATLTSATATQRSINSGLPADSDLVQSLNALADTFR
ncbi:hypothetical protein [Agromyces sp. Soil535]|nr:hypothetical protein [Agromyces sp. Soil535]